MTSFSRRDQDHVLSVSIRMDDKGRPVIASAQASGGCPVLADLAARLEGLPAQEAADHGVLHVVQAHRASGRLAAVAGILTVRAAGPAYERAQTLIRGLVQDIRTATGWTDQRSTWNPDPSPSWVALDDQARQAFLHQALAAFCRSCGLPADSVTLSAMESDVRVTVDLAMDLPASQQPKVLLDLERALRQQTGNRFEIFLHGMQDKNLTRVSP